MVHPRFFFCRTFFRCLQELYSDTNAIRHDRNSSGMKTIKKFDDDPTGKIAGNFFKDPHLFTGLRGIRFMVRSNGLLQLQYIFYKKYSQLLLMWRSLLDFALSCTKIVLSFWANIFPMS